MAHTKADVISTRNELLRLIGKQRDIYAGAIANLDNTKRMLLMVHDGVEADAMTEAPLELTGEAIASAIGNTVADIAARARK